MLEADDALITYDRSVNGMVEYSAGSFWHTLRGNLLLVSFNHQVIYRVVLNKAGDKVTNGEEILFDALPFRPLDITAQGDQGEFPGTIWVANYGSDSITVLEPSGQSGICPNSVSGCHETLLPFVGHTHEP